MKYPRFIVFLVIILSICVFALPATSESQSSQLPSRMVILNVRVTDATGRAVHDVPQSGFQVTEDGVPQKIELFTSDTIPLRYGLMIDCSGSLRDQFADVIRTSALIVKSNQPEDETFLVRFISSDKIETVEELTSDKNKLLRALMDYYVEGGQTAVIDAVYLGTDYLIKKQTNGDRLRRQALVIVTDGEDRSSFYNKQQLSNLLNSTDIQIFTVGFTKKLPSNRQSKAINLLRELAADSGGRVFFPNSASELDRIANEIINDIRTQYVIGYVPTGVDANKSFHKVQVTIAENPNEEKRIAVTRVGYSTQTK